MHGMGERLDVVRHTNMEWPYGHIGRLYAPTQFAASHSILIFCRELNIVTLEPVSVPSSAKRPEDQNVCISKQAEKLNKSDDVMMEDGHRESSTAAARLFYMMVNIFGAGDRLHSMSVVGGSVRDMS